MTMTVTLDNSLGGQRLHEEVGKNGGSNLYLWCGTVRSGRRQVIYSVNPNQVQKAGRDRLPSQGEEGLEEGHRGGEEGHKTTAGRDPG